MSQNFSSCHVMAKPTGSVCNLDCSYCFYLEKEKLYPERNRDWKMSDKVMDLYIKQQIEAQDTEEVVITWQGGEPTMMGLEFFEKTVEVINKYKGDKKVSQSIQTNGILLNDKWCEFFKNNNFLVGISIDGPAHLHDPYRVTRSGKGSHKQVMKAIELLKKHKVDFNTLTVVNDLNSKHPLEVYEFLVGIGSQYLQFIPLVEQEAREPTKDGLVLISPDHDMAADVTPWSVRSIKYGQFLNTIFDTWVRRDVGKVFVNMFDIALNAWCNNPWTACVFAPTCGNAFALEANGDLYTCDHYVYPEHKIGNLETSSIRSMNMSEQAKDFGEAKLTELSNDCKSCPVLFACNGGCPKHRFTRSSSGKVDHNYFCQGYKAFFVHTAPYMQTMKEYLTNGVPPANIMEHVRELDEAPQSLSRNDPCPCGSGKKYKKCCL